jgi:hypothetical protein
MHARSCPFASRPPAAVCVRRGRPAGEGFGGLAREAKAGPHEPVLCTICRLTHKRKRLDAISQNQVKSVLRREVSGITVQPRRAVPDVYSPLLCCLRLLAPFIRQAVGQCRRSVVVLLWLQRGPRTPCYKRTYPACLRISRSVCSPLCLRAGLSQLRSSSTSSSRKSSRRLGSIAGGVPQPAHQPNPRPQPPLLLRIFLAGLLLTGPAQPTPARRGRCRAEPARPRPRAP